MFNTILIANRGEIACRVIRTARELGYKTVAVYSDADAGAVHVKMANQAVHIGPSPVGESYLVADKIIDAAKASGAQAIHPGYGFLSENADFAKACKKAGLVFIGPPPDAIELMGDKAKAKRRMIKAGVPCVPGFQGEKQDDKTLLAEAKKIGLPLMVKAAAGGGGRGMRLVSKEKALANAIKDARSEALNAFGSDGLILEKAVQHPRHVEIQVFADQAGNTIHLGERDCSVQRRHQKVLEEAPCPVMTPELRAAMGEAAVQAAKDIGYVGAGTVEFMLDASGEFYFLEMNTRLQVEHPVTEMVTGLDLVALQIKVAQGEDIGLTQDDIALTGHAIEARLYAEDPAQDFLPATGPVHVWHPAQGPGIRIDSGIESGSEISPFYDPMIAKVIAYGATRDEARQRLITALKSSALFGVTTNKGFLVDALAHPVFADGKATTAFIGENFSDDVLGTSGGLEVAGIAAALIQYELGRQSALSKSFDVPCPLLNWSSATPIATPFDYGTDEDPQSIRIAPISATEYTVHQGDEAVTASLLSCKDGRAELLINEERVIALYYAPSDATLSLSLDAQDYTFTNRNAVIASAADAAGAGAVIAPMHGALLEVFVKEGDTVTKGARLAILEAMKMQHEILAEVDGTVTAINVTAGTQIAADTLMIEIEETE